MFQNVAILSPIEKRKKKDILIPNFRPFCKTSILTKSMPMFFFLNGNIQKTKPKPFKTIYRKGGIKRNPTKHHLNKHLRPHRRSQKHTTKTPKGDNTKKNRKNRAPKSREPSTSNTCKKQRTRRKILEATPGRKGRVNAYVAGHLSDLDNKCVF